MHFESKKEKLFVLLSCIFSILHAIGYIWHGFQIGFNHCIISMIVCDVLYIPSLVKKGKYLIYYIIGFTFILILITAFTDSKLYNNYSALLLCFIGILLYPKYNYVLMGFYLFSAAIGFVLNDAPAYYLVIHTSRSLWIFTIYTIIIYNRYNRKPVILYDDEITILEQLSENKLQKEIDLNGMSERTIRRRLDAAKKRNNIETTDDLIQLYKDVYKNK